MPELHFDAPVQRPPLGGIVGGGRPRRPPALAFNGGIGQAEGLLNGQGNAPGHRLRQPHRVAVDALVPSDQRGIVGIGGELDDDILLAVKILQRLPDLLQECLRHAHHPFIVMQGRNQVSHPDAMGMAFLVTQLADGLGAADLDAIHLAVDDHLLLDRLFADLVIPDLHLHAPVARPSFLGRIAGDRLAVAYPFIGDGFRGKPQGPLEIFGDRARPLAGKADVVPVPLLSDRLGAAGNRYGR